MEMNTNNLGATTHAVTAGLTNALPKYFSATTNPKLNLAFRFFNYYGRTKTARRFSIEVPFVNGMHSSKQNAS
jgi:hypothetical protein